MTLPLTIAFLVLTALFARYQAKEDDIAVQSNNDKGIREHLEHKGRFVYRLMVVGGLGMILSDLGFFLLGTGWSIFLLPLSGIIFSAEFRLRFNALRKKDWRYVSPGNAYDRFWMRLTDRDWTDADFEQRHHEDFYAKGLPNGYVRSVHHAGLLAYLFELTSCSVVVWGILHYHE